MPKVSRSLDTTRVAQKRMAAEIEEIVFFLHYLGIENLGPNVRKDFLDWRPPSRVVTLAYCARNGGRKRSAVELTARGERQHL